MTATPKTQLTLDGVQLVPRVEWDELQAANEALRAERDRLRRTMQIDDERLRLAGERVGVIGGCDTPDDMAEMILTLRARLAQSKATAVTLRAALESYRTELIDMVSQHCTDEGVIYDGALSANEDAIGLLVRDGYLRKIRPDKNFYQWIIPAPVSPMQAEATGGEAKGKDESGAMNDEAGRLTGIRQVYNTLVVWSESFGHWHCKVCERVGRVQQEINHAHYCPLAQWKSELVPDASRAAKGAGQG